MTASLHTDFLLLRHGQSEGNEGGRFGGHGPTPLTGLGQAQAEATARALVAEGALDAIYVSDLLRARQTAAPAERAFGLTAVALEALRERSVGEMTGLTFAEAEARFPVEYAAMMRREPGARPPGGETHAERGAIAAAALDEIAARHPSGRVLLVSHAMTLALLVHHVVGLEPARHGLRVLFRTDNCALHRLRRHSDGMWTVLALNDRSHLGGVG